MSQEVIKFQTEGHRGAVRLNITYDDKSEQNLVTYVHRSAAQLSETSYIWRFTSTVMTMHPKHCYDPELVTKAQKMQGLDKDRWQPEYLFVMFTSRTGAEFTLTVTFVDEHEQAIRRQMVGEGSDMTKKVHNKLRKQVEDRINDLEGDKNGINKIIAEIKALKQKRRDRERLENNQSENDFVVLNIERLNPMVAHQEAAAKPSEDDKILQAKVTRAKQEHDTLVRNMAMLRKWSFIKENRNKYETFVNEREKQRRLRTAWVERIKTLQIIKYLNDFFRHRVAEVRLQERKVKAVRQFQRIAWGPRKLHYGKSKNVRMVNRARQLMTFGT